MSEDIKIIIPGKKKYKIIDLFSGSTNSFNQTLEKIHDIIIQVEGKQELLYRIENRQLTFFITSKCNQRCIMCPQKLDIDSIHNDLIVQCVINNLDYSIIDEVCFTGGEPLLKMNLIDSFIEKSPSNILITILTNGTIFPSSTILNSSRVKLCVPLYSFYDELHNRMTGSSAFYKVIHNLMEISQFNIPIELRFVLTKQNIGLLEEYARFVWRNLPFVQDVAFMGMELTAEAKINKESLWIDPNQYISSLQNAVAILNHYDITAWIYNLPYCLFDEKYRKFLIQSISPWKIKYLPICDKCQLRESCGGMFFSDVKDFEDIIHNCIE
ncbi:radical SAM protein [Treponema pectinovorum]|uniref:radical SAM protein n=1 Tax=Treponema pectinovorum TaxID=164 RepID=UPI00164DCA63|nr:radical SAM protein [Treponema pectinovorum]